MDTLPGYVPIVFIATTLLAVVLFLLAVRGIVRKLAVLLVILIWAALHGWVAWSGYYADVTNFPPEFVKFGVMPVMILMALYFAFAPKRFVDNLSLRALTLVHIVRIPVEIVLYLLAAASTIPEIMTFTGRNYDILTGIFSPIVFFLGFKRGKPRPWVLAFYNVGGLILLANIVVIAVLTTPLTGRQRMEVYPMNKAVLYFPYIWLPTVIVPIVMFSHLSSLWQLLRPKLR
jgi:hypothetical protein